MSIVLVLYFSKTMRHMERKTEHVSDTRIYHPSQFTIFPDFSSSKKMFLSFFVNKIKNKKETGIECS